MKVFSCRVSWLFLLPLSFTEPLRAQTTLIYNPDAYVETFVGSGFRGYLDGTGALTLFNSPGTIAMDSATNLLVFDQNNYRLRKITAAGEVTTLAGNGVPGGQNGLGTNASLSMANSLGIRTNGDVFWGDGNLVRKFSPNGLVSHYAGSFNNFGYADGTVSNAVFGFVLYLTADKADNLYVSDSSNYRIRRITPDGIVTTVAGSGDSRVQDGMGVFSAFASPRDLVADSTGNLFVSDASGLVIRKISPDTRVTTFVGRPDQSGYRDGIGTNTLFTAISGLAVDAIGNLYASDAFGAVRQITRDGIVSTVAGTLNAGFAEGPGPVARFDIPRGIVVESNGESLLVADQNNQRIRRVRIGRPPEPVLTLRMYAGLTIEGVINSVFRIEYKDSLDDVNWTPSSVISLPVSPFLWIDEQSPSGSKRFYRAVLVPQ